MHVKCPKRGAVVAFCSQLSFSFPNSSTAAGVARECKALQPSATSQPLLRFAMFFASPLPQSLYRIVCPLPFSCFPDRPGSEDPQPSP